jgi:hypothetical protein
VGRLFGGLYTKRSIPFLLSIIHHHKLSAFVSLRTNA